jgi:hypothetical protein
VRADLERGKEGDVLCATQYTRRWGVFYLQTILKNVSAELPGGTGSQLDGPTVLVTAPSPICAEYLELYSSLICSSSQSYSH